MLRRGPTFVLKNTSPSKMTEEEKMHFKNKLFKEADQISEKITLQIRDCQEVR